MGRTVDSPEAIAAKVQELVLADIREGAVPISVSSFESLHDHVDANMYLVAASSEDTFEEQMENDYREYNAAIEIVHQWLAAGGHRQAL